MAREKGAGVIEAREIDRNAALRIFGLADRAKPPGQADLRAAYWVLRAHVELRFESAPDEATRAARAEELARLDAAQALLAEPAERVAPGSANALPWWSRSPLATIWALAATVAVVVLSVLLLRPDEEPLSVPVLAGEEASEPAPRTPPARAAPPRAAPPVPGEPRAEVVAQAAPAGAQLTISRLIGAGGGGDTGEREVVAEGPADARSYWLEPGEYELEVRHPDCSDRWRETVTVEAGDALDLQPRTCAHTGFVEVRSNVSGDSLEIDGRSVGGTGPERRAVPAGEHRIRVEKPGYEPWEGLVDVAPGEVLRLRADLAEARAEPATSAQHPAPEAADEQDEERAPAWHDQATSWLLARYDHDGSGRLDADSELDSIPCADWRALESSLASSGLALPLIAFYGFDGVRPRNDALGVSAPYRAHAFDRMKGCGLRHLPGRHHGGTG